MEPSELRELLLRLRVEGYGLGALMGSEYALKIHEPILADALCHDCGYSWTVFLSGGILSADEIHCPECESTQGTLFLGGYEHGSEG